MFFPVFANTPSIVSRIPEAIKRDVETILRQQSGGFSDVSLNIAVSLPPTIPSMGAVVSYNYQLVAYSNYLGRSYIPVQLLGRGNVRLARIQVTVDAVGEGNVVVTTRQLSKGDIISSSDLAIKRDTLLGQQRTGFGLIDDVVGKETLSAIGAGSMVTRLTIRSVPDIRRGDSVSVDYRNGPIRLRILGIALADAKIGEKLKVRLKLESHRIMEGEVIDATTVRIRSSN